MLLGLGSTLGIVAAVRWSCCRTCGPPASRYRPRFDFRGTGLGHTLRLGVWTVLFVVVNQIAYTVVVRLASSGTADACAAAAATGTGYTIYSNAFLLVMVPHAIITVSLATAMLPRLSALRRRRRPARRRRARVAAHAAHGARADRAVRAAAAGDRARPGQRDLGLRRRPADRPRLRAVAGAVRARAGASSPSTT